MAINVMLQKQSGARDFPTSSQQGVFGIHDGFLRTIGDIMEICDEFWRAKFRSTVINSSIKSECLSESHVQWCTELLRDILIASPFNTSDVDAPIANSEILDIEHDPNIVQSLDISQIPASVIQEEVISSTMQFL